MCVAASPPLLPINLGTRTTPVFSYLYLGSNDVEINPHQNVHLVSYQNMVPCTATFLVIILRRERDRSPKMEDDGPSEENK